MSRRISRKSAGRLAAPSECETPWQRVLVTAIRTDNSNRDHDNNTNNIVIVVSFLKRGLSRDLLED
jgi:hypothetical protein